MSTAANLISAMTAWEDRPGDETRAKAMEAATQRHAYQLGIAATELRARLATHRRNGLTIREAVTEER